MRIRPQRLSMNAETGNLKPSIVVRALAGLETGVLGGAAMLLWFALVSVWQDQLWYAVPNLLAGVFYGESIFRAGFGFVTLTGIALHLVSGGIAGAVFGIVAPAGQTPPRMLLLGLLGGLLWFYFNQYLLWRRTNPLLIYYTAESSMVAAHLLFGVFLGRLSWSLRLLDAHFRGPAA
jgi:hypothetical protein